MSTKPAYYCHACRTNADVHFVAVEVEGVQVTFPNWFVFAYRGVDQPVGLCNLCFQARRFGGLTADEVAYFEKEFSKPDDTPES